MGLGLVERGRAPGRKAPKDIMHKIYVTEDFFVCKVAVAGPASYE